MYVYVSVYIYVNVYVNVYVYAYVKVYVCKYVCTLFMLLQTNLANTKTVPALAFRMLPGDLVTKWTNSYRGVRRACHSG